jgi:prevent-host-death family protein
MNVSVRNLKDHLSEYLRRVQNGEQVTVTDHGRPIAALVSLAKRGKTLEERFAQMAAAGDITLPTRKGFAKIRRSRVRGPSVASTLLDDRE